MVTDSIQPSGFFNGAYRGKKVFLTGHSGFKGSWLTLWLKVLGAQVTGYSLRPGTNPSLFDCADINGMCTTTFADVRDQQRLISSMSEAAPDIVIHMAAQSLVRMSYEEPRETYETNVMGTVNVLEAVRRTPTVRLCISVTSDKCYENREWVYAYREVDPMGGYDPYSSSKGCAELVGAAYRRSFFNPKRYVDHAKALVSVRAGNVIGGGDWALDRIVPDIALAISRGEAVTVRNPGFIRPWQFVLEPLAGYLWLGARLLDNPTAYDYGWNFGPGSESCITVRELVEKAVALWGRGGWTGTGDRMGKAYEANFLKLDSTKARTILGWRPLYSIDETLRATVEWYHGFYEDPEFDPKAFTLQQIEAYCKRARDVGTAWACEAV